MTDSTLHIAVIMDGNGRWAQAAGLPRSAGHERAHLSVESTVTAALENGVTHLSLFAFSSENWNRPESEVALLMQPERWLVTEHEVESYRQRNVQVAFLGDLNDPRIPATCSHWLRTVEEHTTTHNPQLRVTVAFNYGGRQEIAEAARLCGTKTRLGAQEDFHQHMWSAHLPDIDLLIRTSGEHRISNFMLWSLWYAELIFTDTLWPDFRAIHFSRALTEYRMRHRRYGTLSG
ncbi:polyprenyl diphosphate synthase [Streptomyces sp. RP5T]|uniref:polyprenyl diphosphate synthase n=1 Tax=Streptomyces sp. RP5T TaxID=2490848 RepID=UPI000F648C56|nr:polyprenyl diphosphate synthase [Streptomyces sp. RP5T]RRR76717.1 di-trans,poly-cis-decaprenylcistransferase [Streptomyces sp. RP5T]